MEGERLIVRTELPCFGRAGYDLQIIADPGQPLVVETAGDRPLAAVAELWIERLRGIAPVDAEDVSLCSLLARPESGAQRRRSVSTR
jgi:hypothetical protein